MKKLFLLLCMTVASMVIHAQESWSLYRYFPNDAKKNRNYSPLIRTGKIGDQYVYGVMLKASDDYFSIGDDGYLLIKFDNDSTFKIFRRPNTQVTKTYENQRIPYLGLLHYYYTYAIYDIPDDYIDMLLNGNHGIKKIRVKLMNGVNRDYDIEAKYGIKLGNALRLDFETVTKSNEIRQQKMESDEDF